MTDKEQPLDIDLDAVKSEALKSMSKEDAEKYGENLWQATLKQI